VSQIEDCTPKPYTWGIVHQFWLLGREILNAELYGWVAFGYFGGRHQGGLKPETVKFGKGNASAKQFFFA
jgi:hypothetical protein